MDLIKLAKTVEALEKGLGAYGHEMRAIPSSGNHQTFLWQMEHDVESLPDSDEKTYYLALFDLERRVATVNILRSRIKK